MQQPDTLQAILGDPSGVKTNGLIRLFATIPVLIYIIVAIFLTIVAIISLFIAGSEIVHMLLSGSWSAGIIKVIDSILLTVIIIELFETVTVYLRTKRVPVRAILIAGLTAMIRHVIIFNISEAEPLEIIGPSIMLAVLIAGIYLLKEDVRGDMRV